MTQLVLIGDDIAVLLAEAEGLRKAGYEVQILVKHRTTSVVFDGEGQRRNGAVASASAPSEELLSRCSDCESVRPDYAANRWAKAVALLVKSESDVRTIAGWGQSIGASAGAIRSWCRSAKVSPRHSLVLARLLRAVWQARGQSWRAEQFLDVADERTLLKIVHAGGISSSMDGVDLQDVLRRQSLISDPHAVNALTALLSQKPLESTAHFATAPAGST